MEEVTYYNTFKELLHVLTQFEIPMSIDDMNELNSKGSINLKNNKYNFYINSNRVNITPFKP